MGSQLKIYIANRDNEAEARNEKREVNCKPIDGIGYYGYEYSYYLEILNGNSLFVEREKKYLLKHEMIRLFLYTYCF